jgi:hypothetical protein
MAKSTRNNGIGSTEKETESSKGEIRKRAIRHFNAKRTFSKAKCRFEICEKADRIGDAKILA